MAIKKIAVLTTGGDAPGMNAAIRAVVRTAASNKIDVIGVFRGWWGLINEELMPLTHRSVSGIINQGGTILKTQRCPEFITPEGMERAAQTIKKNNIDGIIVIGGNGSFTAAHEFYKKHGVACIGIPASIDNDINGFDATIGVDTAINTALMAIDNIRDTATSMERIFVVEVMGRESGFIALMVALADGCEDVIIPEKKFDCQEMCHRIVDGNIRGKASWIIVVAEGAGKAEKIARQITEVTSLDTRAVVLGHIQRGGRPTAVSRNMALRLGYEAVIRLRDGESDKAVGFHSSKIICIDLEETIKKKPWGMETAYNLIKILT